MPRLPLAAAIAAFALTAATARADDWDHTYTIGNTTRLNLQTGDAHVYVQPGAPGVVRMHVHTRDLKIGGRVTIDVQTSGNTWSAAVREKPHWFGISIDFQPRIVVDLIVPPQCQLAVRTGDGGIDAERVAGSIQLHTGDGGIRAHDLKGQIVLDTGDGGIHATALDGGLTAHSGDGSVRIEGRFDALDVTTGDGGIAVTALAGSRVTSGWRVHTGDGGLVLRLPRDVRAELDARTGDGAIDLGLPVDVVGDVGRHRLHGTLNGGGGLIQLESGDGSIHIDAA